MPTKLATEIAAAIAINTAVSGAVCLGNRRLAAIQMPTAWDAANLTFQGSFDGVTFQNVYDAFGNEVTVTAAASRAIALDVSQFAGLAYLKIRSGTAATPVNQTAARTLGLSAIELVG